ncbi:hypothetical protein V495_03391 [Pseudogymnoascus sp. VKM F-4514 (FW-929)]|nr:hypothetical protein V495_03391 [Pseudogymnoascus sp. VKM F-4514 (FW-929)]KFY61446.1 hypothetical protein V497_02965 [Pseudogymnoascus sp. VKM F-4516 (FW-969)]
MPHATSDEYSSPSASSNPRYASSSTSSSSSPSTTSSRAPTRTPSPSPLHLLTPPSPDFSTRLAMSLTTPSTPRLFSAVMAEERMRCVIEGFDLVMGESSDGDGRSGVL